MAGGRPPRGQKPRRPWLEELAGWLNAELTATGQSRRAFANRNGLDYKVLCRIANAERIPAEDTVRLIASALRHSWASVEPLWRRAKEGEREAERRHREASIPRLTSWTGLPVLPGELEELLDAQCEANNMLPYQLLGVQAPPLSDIYVRQTLQQYSTRSDRPRPGADTAAAGPSTEQIDRPMLVSEALDQYQHLLITGDPGAGKSTLASMFVRQIAQRWLAGGSGDAPIREPVLPIRIAAQALAGDDAWTELVATGVRQALHGLALARPRPELFAGQVYGARWLIFIDGLDEIIDTATRRQVLRAIARQLRRGGTSRLVITGRRLPDSQADLLLGPELRSPELGTFTIKPFDVDDLEEFATSWFHAQDPLTAQPRSREFLRQLRDKRLSTVVTNPLLATIAATVYTREPDHPLPSNQVGLYNRFLSYLLDDHASGRNPMASLAGAPGGHPARTEFLRAVSGRLPELVSELAIALLETSRGLGPRAIDWVSRELGEPPFESWRDDVIELLLGLGVFTRYNDGISFLHYSFAEFLAAKKYASEIPAEFADLDSWIRCALDDPGKEQFVLFTLAQWSRQPGRDPNLILRRLLAGDQRWLVLAGKLTGEVGQLDPGLSKTLADRLINILLVAEDIRAPLEPVCRALGGWVRPEADAYLVRRLRSLLASAELSAQTRLLCAIALGYARGGSEADPFLAALTPEISPEAITSLVSAWSELVPDGVSRAELALTARANARPQPASFYFHSAATLLDCGRTDSARSMLRRFFERSSDHAVADGTAEQLAQPYRRAPAAELAGRLGMPETVELAWGTIDSPGCRARGLAIAARALLTVAPDQAGALLLRLAAAPIEHRAELAPLLYELGHREAALELGRSVIGEGWRSYGLTAHVVSEVMGKDPSCADDLTWLARDWPIVPAYHAAELAEALAQAGYPERAKRLAVHTLEARDAGGWDTKNATSVLLKLDFPAEEILALVEKCSLSAVFGIVEGLCEAGRSDSAATLFASHRAQLDYDDFWALRAMRSLWLAGEKSSCADFVAGSGVAPVSSFISFAHRCVLMLEVNEDFSVVPHLGPRLGDATMNEQTVQCLLEAWYLHRPAARAEIAQMLTDYPVLPEVAVLIGNIMASRGLLDDACSAWLRVYGSEDAPVELLLAVTARLIGCGLAQAARERLAMISAREVLTPAVRRNLSWLTSWLDASAPHADPSRSPPAVVGVE